MSEAQTAARKSLNDLIEKVAGEYHTTDGAAKALLEMAREDGEAYSALVGPYEIVAARRAIQGAWKNQREIAWNGNGKRKSSSAQGTSSSRAEIMAHANSTVLMDFRLPGGLPLSMAGCDELRDAARHYIEQATDMAWKGRWLKRLAESLPEGKRISDHFSESDLSYAKEMSNVS